MEEQKETDQFLADKNSIEIYFIDFKAKLEKRLHTIFDGFIKLKQKGYCVDAITPQGGIYLTVKIDLAGKVANGNALPDQSAVTDYILREASLAVVPFYAFGAKRNSPWYRLSVGTCKLEDIDEMFKKLEAALEKVE